MKVLHTSDWHVGKKLGRYDRSDEYRAVIDEVVEIAAAEDVDLVLHSGDLFDRPVPPTEALQIALDGLVALTDGGRRPVVVIAGNHDSAPLFEALAPFLRHVGISLVGDVHRPEDGGVLDLETAAGRAVVSCFPFLRQGRVVGFWDDMDKWYGTYADRLARISARYAQYAAELAGSDAVTFLLGHFLVGGAKVHGHGAPRGERELHVGEAYAAKPDAIPPGPQYVAMGHIHAPQPVPGVQVPGEYAGSLLQLDFGEAGEDKRVVIVDVEPGLPARVSSRPITRGRRLIRATGTLAELEARDDLADAYLDLAVVTTGPDPELSDLVRERFPYVVKVRAEYPRQDTAVDVERGGRPLDALFAAYHEAELGTPAPDPLIDAFRELLEEVET